MPAQELALETLYEDEHLIAINKPPGLVVHPTYRHTEGTVMNALLWQARGWRGSDRPSMVNRLDKLTSGIVIGAKTARAHAAMQRALAGDRAAKEISRAGLWTCAARPRHHRPAPPPRSARSPAGRGVERRRAERHAIGSASDAGARSRPA